ncbi:MULTISPECIES: rho GDP-dissociation inhibitor [unclassified Streptomyces]|uniref:hypothetical protein n=1 Tax=Streptomyces sp. NPDC127129 TaxID=3345373 RepID=UPI0036297EB7
MVSLADTAPAVAHRERPTVRLLGLELQYTGHEDISVPVPAAEKVSAPFTVKEGTECRAVVRFQVDGSSVAGLKVVDIRHRAGTELGGREVALGDFRHGGPYELALPPERVPNGTRARGLYEVSAALVDGEGRVLDRSDYRFEVRKDWDPASA